MPAGFSTSPSLVHAAGFRCLTSGAGAAVLVTLGGELDIASAPRLRAALCAAQDRAGTVVLDLRRLGFSDICGVRVMIAADRRIRRDGGRLLVVRAPAEVQGFFTLIGLDHLLRFVEHPPGEVDLVAVRTGETLGPGAFSPASPAA